MTNQQHAFIFSPGEWLGQGKVGFSTSKDELRFYTKWIFIDRDREKIFVEQRVEKQDDELLINYFCFSNITATTFTVEMENEVLGKKITGSGTMDDRHITWTFNQLSPEDGLGIVGVERYTLQENGDYILEAEYDGHDNYRTIIEGRIWKRT